MNEQMDDAPEAEAEVPEENSEDRAKRMGWKPKDAYKGPEGKWVEAEEFLRRAEEDPREVRKANEILMRKLQKVEQGVAAMQAHQERELAAARREEYARAQADLKRAHDAAVSEGDIEKADKAWKARDVLATRQVEEAKAPANGVDHQSQEILNAWKAENPWYGQNYKATKEANEHEDWLARQGIPLAERLRRTAEYIGEEVLVAKPKRVVDEAPSPVNGQNNNGKLRGNRVPKPGSYEALTTVARAECDRVVRTSGGKITKELWVSYADQDLFAN